MSCDFDESLWNEQGWFHIIYISKVLQWVCLLATILRCRDLFKEKLSKVDRELEEIVSDVPRQGFRVKIVLYKYLTKGGLF